MKRLKKVIKLDSNGNTASIELDNPTLELALLIIDNAEGVSQQDYDNIQDEKVDNDNTHENYLTRASSFL